MWWEHVQIRIWKEEVVDTIPHRLGREKTTRNPAVIRTGVQ
jgi:hypothetical protein